MSNTFFITGTDTGVGKTLVTAGLLCLARAKGQTAYGLKPIAAGCIEADAGLVNDDALMLQRDSSVALTYRQVNPVALQAPLAPHIAAAREGKRLSLERLEGFVRGSLMTKAQWRFIEGAGGWRVPLAPGQYLSDLPKRLACPVILVVGMRLGCLNHALLTAEAIRKDGLQIVGWVASCLEKDMPALQENIETLRFLMQAPCLGVVPYLDEPSPEHVTEHLSLPEWKESAAENPS